MICRLLTVPPLTLQARQMEAAILVMKQRIDEFALQHGISRLERDCATLGGLVFRQETADTENSVPPSKVPRGCHFFLELCRSLISKFHCHLSKHSACFSPRFNYPPPSIGYRS